MRETATTRSPLRRGNGEGSHSIDPRNGRHLWRSRSLVPGQMITGRGANLREAKADARSKASHILAGRPSGKPETFGEMATAWISWAEDHYPRTTWRDYRTPINKWLPLGAVWNMAAEDVRPSDIEAVYKLAIGAGNKRRTLEGIKTSASLAYTWAIADGRVAHHGPGSLWNPALATRIPRSVASRGSRSAPDPATVAAFLTVADGRFNGAVWRVMAECATRPSEAAGLRWADIDWEGGRIRLRGALRWDEALGEYRWDEGLKNGSAGERDIPIGSELLALLRHHRAALAELRLGSEWASDEWAGDLVFRKPHDGTALDSQHLTLLHKGISTEAGGVRFVPYQLRHHLPTQMAANGVPLAVCAQLLGIDERTAERYYIDRPESAVDYSVIRAALDREVANG